MKDISSLDDLMESALKVAKKIVAEGEQLSPVFIGANVANEAVLYMVPWANQEEKTAGLETVREQFAKHDVVRYVSVVETWTAPMQQGSDGKTIMPSKCPDRVEMVVIAGVDRAKGSKCRTFELKRDQAKPYLEELTNEGGKYQGNIFNLIPKAN